MNEAIALVEEWAALSGGMIDHDEESITRALTALPSLTAFAEAWDADAAAARVNHLESVRWLLANEPQTTLLGLAEMDDAQFEALAANYAAHFGYDAADVAHDWQTAMEAALERDGATVAFAADWDRMAHRTAALFAA